MIHRSIAVAVFLACGGSLAAKVPPSLSSLPYVAQPTPTITTSGRLVADDIATIAAAGIRHVIDLSLDAETPALDESEAVSRAGMRYHPLPIRGADDLNRNSAVNFDALLKATNGEPTLVHCASSNRVGALAALRAAWIVGLPMEAAIEEGRRWGLKSLEPAVRAQLEHAPNGIAQ